MEQYSMPEYDFERLKVWADKRRKDLQEMSDFIGAIDFISQCKGLMAELQNKIDAERNEQEETLAAIREKTSREVNSCQEFVNSWQEKAKSAENQYKEMYKRQQKRLEEIESKISNAIKAYEANCLEQERVIVGLRDDVQELRLKKTNLLEEIHAAYGKMSETVERL